MKKYSIFTAIILLLCSCKSNNSRNNQQNPDNGKKNIYGQCVLDNSKNCSISLSRTYRTDVSTAEDPSLEELYDSKFCTKLTTKECATVKQNIANMSETGNFDLSKNPITNNILGVKSVSNNMILYYTKSPLNDDPVAVSGKIIMPEGLSKDKIKGVILYFHPTVFDPRGPDKIEKNNSDDIVYASLYATKGYIVLLPDYNGLGQDANQVHPYVLYPRVNDLSGLYLLSAARDFINQTYQFKANEELKLFTSGYSEGGAYSIWFSKLSQTDNIFSTELKKFNYTLKASVGMDGAYDLSGTIKPFLWSEVDKSNNIFNIEEPLLTNAVKPALAAMALMSYGYMKNYDQNPVLYKSLFSSDFFDMKCSPSLGVENQKSCQINGEQLDLYQALRYQNAVGDVTILEPIVFSALDKTQNYGVDQFKYIPDGLVGINKSTKNSMRALANPKLENDPDFNKTLENADIVKWDTKLPVHFITLHYDSVVSPNNSNNAYSGTLPKDLVKKTIIDNSKIQVNNLGKYKYILPQETTNVDHVSGATFLNIIASKYFEEQK